VKIGARGFFVLRREPPPRHPHKKTSRVAFYAPAGQGREAKTPYRIVMKFCTGVDVPDITDANFVAIGSGVLVIRGVGSNFQVFH